MAGLRGIIRGLISLARIAILMDFQLTDEQQMIQAAARDFARDEIAPIAQEFDASGEFPRDDSAHG